MNKNLFRRIYNQIVPSITQWLPRYYAVLRLIGKEGLILDASCGTGDITIALKKKGVKVIGINISQEEIMVAREKAEKEGTRIDFIVGDLTNTPFKDDTFTQIVSLDTLEHIKDDNKVFQEFARQLKVPGRLIISVPWGATNSTELFQEQKNLRKLIPRFLYTDTSFNGRSWLEASERDTMKEMKHFRNYSVNKLKRKITCFFKIARYEYALKKFSSLATDTTYGIKACHFLKPFMFFITVRLDRYFQKNKKGYLLICEFQKLVK